MVNKIYFYVSITMISIFILTGCSSIVSKSDYPISIASTPTGASVVISDLKKGKEIFKGITPCNVTLKAKSGFFSPAKYSVVIKKPGYESQNVTLTASLDGWYFGNILFGGLIGMLIVDPATGAMWKLPNDINITLSQTKTGVSMKYQDREMKIVFYDDIPESWKQKLIKIN